MSFIKHNSEFDIKNEQLQPDEFFNIMLYNNSIDPLPNNGNDCLNFLYFLINSFTQKYNFDYLYSEIYNIFIDPLHIDNLYEKKSDEFSDDIIENYYHIINIWINPEYKIKLNSIYENIKHLYNTQKLIFFHLNDENNLIKYFIQYLHIFKRFYTKQFNEYIEEFKNNINISYTLSYQE